MKSSFLLFLRKALLWLILINLAMVMFFFIVRSQQNFLYTSLIGLVLSLFFYLTSAGFYAYTLKLGTVKPAKFVNGYMILSIAKLLLYLLVLVVCLFFFKDYLKIFLILYVINYLVFTIFEVVLVTKSLKSIQKSQDNTK